VSAPLQVIVFSSYLLNVLLQLANKNEIQKHKKNLQQEASKSRGQTPSLAFWTSHHTDVLRVSNASEDLTISFFRIKMTDSEQT
jgi:hypothetical protein